MKPSPTVRLTVPPLTPHRDVIRELRKAVHEPGGAICPTCTQHAQVYRWSLYSTAVHALILFYRLGGTTDYIHSNQLKDHGHKGQGDAARLRLWGFVDREADARPDGGRSGFWRVNDFGEEFITEQALVNKYVYVYNSRVLGVGGPLIGVREALGTSFNYQQMMDGPG